MNRKYYVNGTTVAILGRKEGEEEAKYAPYPTARGGLSTLLLGLVCILLLLLRGWWDSERNEYE